MKYLNINPSIQGAEDAEDIQIASELLEQKLVDIDSQLAQLSETDTLKRAELLLDYGSTSLELKKEFQAWQIGQQAFQLFAAAENWEGAVQAWI